MTILLSIYVLWLFYLAVMSLYRAKLSGTITRTSLILGYPILIMGMLLDIVVNFFIGSVVFFELPRQFFLTQRLKMHMKNNDGWRSKLANWICTQLLNSFDPSGNHCK